MLGKFSLKIYPAKYSCKLLQENFSKISCCYTEIVRYSKVDESTLIAFTIFLKQSIFDSDKILISSQIPYFRLTYLLSVDRFSPFCGCDSPRNKFKPWEERGSKYSILTQYFPTPVLLIYLVIDLSESR